MSTSISYLRSYVLSGFNFIQKHVPLLLTQLFFFHSQFQNEGADLAPGIT